jgi:site-specific recombinase XerD
MSAAHDVSNGFAASQISLDSRSGEHRRHHVQALVLQRTGKDTTRKASLAQVVSCHTLRDSFATHL